VRRPSKAKYRSSKTGASCTICRQLLNPYLAGRCSGCRSAIHLPVSATVVLNPQLQFGLLTMLRLVDIQGSVDLQSRASPTYRDLPVASDRVHMFPLADRPQSFFDRTSCNIALSSDRSATIFFSLLQDKGICASENFDAFMELSFCPRRDYKWKIPASNGPI